MSKQQTAQKAEQILNSLDAVRKVAAPDFFYTRLKARMEKEEEAAQPVFFLFRPAFAASCLSLMLMANVLLLAVKNQPQPTVGKNAAAEAEQFAREYNLDNTGTLYE